MGLKEAFRYLSSDAVALPHKYPMGAELRYHSPQAGPVVTLRVIGRLIRENYSGVAVSYRCRQFRNGEVLRDTLEIDECELTTATERAE